MESLHIRELGILRDSEFDTTKSLILLAGPNRTGKTLVSYLMYGLNLSWHMEINDNDIDAIKYELKYGELSLENNEALLHNLYSGLESVVTQNKPVLSKLFNLLNENFAIDYSAKIKVINKSSISFEDITFEFDSSLTNKPDYSKNDTLLDEKIISIISDKLAYCSQACVFFLPCERLFATMVGGDLVRAEYKSSRQHFEISESSILPRYAEPIMNYILFIDDLEYLTKITNPTYTPIADFLNHQLMGGQVQWRADLRRLVFNEYRTNNEIPFHLSASGIKALTGLEIYLRHFALDSISSYPILFFDEPELNLHPKAQRVVARVIARMINAGIKVVVSTHSDYIISQLSNLVVLGSAYQKDPEKVMRWVQEHDLDYEPEDFLLPEQVAPYHFDFVESGEYAQATLIETSEKGFFFPSMDEVIFDLSNEINRLYAELIES